MSNIAPLYMFRDAPPIGPWLYFSERVLLGMAGGALCSFLYVPPQYTILSGAGLAVGRWTLRFDFSDPLTDESPWKFSMGDMLAGMRMGYEDFESGQRWVWVLTDEVVRHDDDDHLRMAHWPD